MSLDKINVVLVGAGGYGEVYLSEIKSFYEKADNPVALKAIVDPFAKSAPSYQWMLDNNVPIFDTLQEFYRQNGADLAIIATPIPLHGEHCLVSIENSTNVLCEKPLTATVQDGMELKSACDKYDVKFAVGYQWSFSTPILKLKEYIMSGAFGNPLLYKGFSVGNRTNIYFDHPWKGKVRDRQGRWSLDCVVSNATSHYLHNLFFLKGDAMDKAALPKEAYGELYRVKPDMEMPDMVAVKGVFSDNCPFLYTTSYSLEGKARTQFYLEFEKARVSCDFEVANGHITVQFNDGRTLDLGNPNDPGERMKKLHTMLGALKDSRTPIPCSLETAIPHVKVCNGLFDYCPIHQVDGEFLTFGDGPAQTSGSSVLNDGLYEAYLENKLPGELDFPWARKAGFFSLEDIDAFRGLIIT